MSDHYREVPGVPEGARTPERRISCISHPPPQHPICPPSSSLYPRLPQPSPSPHPPSRSYSSKCSRLRSMTTNRGTACAPDRAASGKWGCSVQGDCQSTVRRLTYKVKPPPCEVTCVVPTGNYELPFVFQGA